VEYFHIRTAYVCFVIVHTKICVTWHVAGRFCLYFHWWTCNVCSKVWESSGL
jgi:hypothetical protein